MTALIKDILTDTLTLDVLRRRQSVHLANDRDLEMSARKLMASTTVTEICNYMAGNKKQFCSASAKQEFKRLLSRGWMRSHAGYFLGWKMDACYSFRIPEGARLNRKTGLCSGYKVMDDGTLVARGAAAAATVKDKVELAKATAETADRDDTEMELAKATAETADRDDTEMELAKVAAERDQLATKLKIADSQISSLKRDVYDLTLELDAVKRERDQLAADLAVAKRENSGTHEILDRIVKAIKGKMTRSDLKEMVANM